MAAQYNALNQTVNAAAPILYTGSLPCNSGHIFHRDDSGVFLLASMAGCRGCNCCGQWITPVTVYAASVHINAQISEGGTVAPITFGIAVDGEVDPSSIVTITPTAAEEPGVLETQTLVSIPAVCGCGRVSVRNIGTDPVEVLNGNIIFDFVGVRR